MAENIVVPFAVPADFQALAVEKLKKELKSFSGGQKEKAVSEFVASTLTHFCEQDSSFAEVVYKTKRTLSDCCAEVMAGCGNHISDIDVYRGAVKAYFPNADITFTMTITITGDAPTEEELARPPKKKPQSTPKKRAAPKTTPKPVPKTDKEPKQDGPQAAKNAAEKPQKQEIIQLSLF